MQSDKTLADSLLKTEAWEREPVTGKKGAEVKRFELPGHERGKLSFSGYERNHLFKNINGQQFTDISSISGLDAPQDSRAFAVWDFNRDGWQDLAMVNINAPVLSIYRNQFAKAGMSHAGATSTATEARMIAVQFVGGNQSAQPSRQFGSRDGFGVKATVNLVDQKFVRELRCGEGLAAQNSNTMLFGLGKHESVASILIQWPSGITQQLNDIPAGQLVTVFENSADSSDGSGFDRSQYILPEATPQTAAVNFIRNKPFLSPSPSTAPLIVYTSMATWCPNCRKQIPQLERLRNHFSEQEVSLIGVPVDESETSAQLKLYMAERVPPYGLAGSWDAAHREDFKKLVREQLNDDLLPATVVTNSQGQVLKVIPGVPNVSEMARLLQLIKSQPSVLPAN